MDQKLPTDEIICDRCGSRPEVAVTESGSMYKGVRCNECKKIECLNCKGLPPDRACSWCGGKVSPIGNINEPVSTKVSHSVKCLYCGKEIDKNAFACPHCGRAVMTAKQSELVDNKENHGMEDLKYHDKSRGLEVIAKPVALRTFYYPGDLVQTIVTINSAKNSSVREITASLVLYQPPGQSFLDRITGLPLVGSRLRDGMTPIVTQVLRKGGKLQAGFSESYEVEIRIPDDIVPPLATSSGAIIGYMVWISEPSTDWGISIISPIGIGVPPPSQDFDPFTRTVTGKNLEITLELPRLHWVRGEKIHGKIKVRSLKPNYGPISVRSGLNLQADKGVNSTPVIENIATESLATKIIIPFGEVVEYDFEVAIPTNLPPTLKSPRYSVQWELHIFAGIGVFSNTNFSQLIYVYSVPAREKPIPKPAAKKINNDAAESNNALGMVQEPSLVYENLTGEQKMVLLRLRELHNNVSKAKSKGNAWGQPLLFGGMAGVAACFIISIPLVYVVRAINGSSEPSAIPGCVGLVFLMLTGILTSVFLRRNAQQHSVDLVTKEELNLNLEIDKIAALQPDWVNKIGGVTSLLDSRTVDSLLKTK